MFSMTWPEEVSGYRSLRQVDERRNRALAGKSGPSVTVSDNIVYISARLLYKNGCMTRRALMLFAIDCSDSALKSACAAALDPR